MRVTLALAVWPGHATAQELNRFGLFSNCGAMGLDVFIIDGADVGLDVGLTKDRIQTLAESRLRAARVYTTTPRSCRSRSPSSTSRPR